MKRTLFAVMALLASGAALADECSSANTQTEMNQCAAAQYQAADKKLNDTWQQALQRAVGKQQTLLKQAQQAWIALRDADCAFLASGAEGGSMQPMLVSQCMTDKSVERESFLASLLQCEDGDQSCPLPPANQRTRMPSIIIRWTLSTVCSKKAASCSVAPVTASTWVAKSA